MVKRCLFSKLHPHRLTRSFLQNFHTHMQADHQRSSDRATERSSDRAIERSSEPAIERSSDRATEQSGRAKLELQPSISHADHCVLPHLSNLVVLTHSHCSITTKNIIFKQHKFRANFDSLARTFTPIISRSRPPANVLRCLIKPKRLNKT